MGLSKKNVSGLAEDFRAKLVDYAAKAAAERGGQWLLPLCVLTATGCRPAELVTGVRLRRGSDQRTLEFVIRGAKLNVDQGRGIALRIVGVATHDDQGVIYPWAAPLLQEVVVGGGSAVVKLASANAFCTRVSEASKKLWPRRKVQVSPYSFRHAFCGDLKTAGLDPVEVAKVMGHASTRAQVGYGRRKKGGGGQSPIISVTASAQPRRAPDRLVRFRKVKAAEVHVPDLGQVAAKLDRVAVSRSASGATSGLNVSRVRSTRRACP